MGKNIFMFLARLCVFLGLSMVSCSSDFDERLRESFGFSGREDVSFVLPELENCDEWNVYVRSGTGFSVFAVHSGKVFFLSLEKNVPCSVKAVPVMKEDFPASEENVLPEEDISAEENNLPLSGKNPLVYGLVYPFVSDFSVLHGFSADILSEFYKNAESSGNSDETMKDFISRFNWKKFCSSLEKNMAADENYNPWLLDRKKILKSIESGKFSAGLLKV